MKIEKLTRADFAAYGDVIAFEGSEHFTINNGFAERFDDLANVDVIGGGAAKVSLFEVKPRPAPIKIDMMERHPLGSQAFYPLQNEDWLVLVCDDPRDQTTYRCFRATGQQGINLSLIHI